MKKNNVKIYRMNRSKNYEMISGNFHYPFTLCIYKHVQHDMVLVPLLYGSYLLIKSQSRATLS